MGRRMSRQEWQVAVLSLADSRKHLLAAGEVELHLLSENVRVLLEDKNNPAMAALVLRRLIRDDGVAMDAQRQFANLAAQLNEYSGVEVDSP